MTAQDPYPSDRQLELAQERTTAAEWRTQLAEERTFSAWIRTGLASLATGLAIAKLMSEAGPSWLTRTLGTLFVLVGGAIFAIAYGAYHRAAGRMRDAVPSRSTPAWVMGLMTLVLLLGTVVAVVLVFLD